MLQRSRLAVNVGNLLELLGAACGVYGIYRLVGFAWALIAAAVLLVVAAEFIYDGRLVALPLPRRPHPRARLTEARQRFAVKRYRWRARRSGL